MLACEVLSSTEFGPANKQLQPHLYLRLTEEDVNAAIDALTAVEKNLIAASKISESINVSFDVAPNAGLMLQRCLKFYGWFARSICLVNLSLIWVNVLGFYALRERIECSRIFWLCSKIWIF